MTFLIWKGLGAAPAFSGRDRVHEERPVYSGLMA